MSEAFNIFNHVLSQFEPLANGGPGFPIYDITIDESTDTALIELATAGFSSKDLQVTQEGNRVIVSGSIKKGDVGTKTFSLGPKRIARRDFTRTFELSDYMKVKSVGYEDGILSIVVQRIVPESKKPKVFTINGRTGSLLQE